MLYQVSYRGPWGLVQCANPYGSCWLKSNSVWPSRPRHLSSPIWERWWSQAQRRCEAGKTTARGFEPLRAEPNGFLVHHLNHSVTLSLLSQEWGGTASVACDSHMRLIFRPAGQGALTRPVDLAMRKPKHFPDEVIICSQPELPQSRSDSPTKIHQARIELATFSV